MTAVAESTAARIPTLKLESLVPRFEETQHGTYRDELVDLLTDDARRERVWNIALTGGYGSGKSSVLAGVREKLDKRVVEVSLSSLSDVGVGSDKQSDELNNDIQKEIVKQLLYREPPSRVPGSRFRRISRLPVGRTLLGSLLAGVVAVAVLWVTGWGAPFALAPADEGQRPWRLLAAGVAVAFVAYVTQALFHNRIRIDKLGTSATSVSLTPDADAGSYFDEYLDEIVYFFEKTRRDIMIIEDLDRFEDPAIYSSLRELNTVLNTSRQLAKRPVHFIYAVRDSIFEDIKVAPKDDVEAWAAAEAAAAIAVDGDAGVWQADRALSDAATQRTKFFDLVVPIVPFITHQSAADLLFDLARTVDPGITYDVVRVVAKHVTDMRLLRNILNEYRVFHARVIEGGKLRGLTPRGLFALVAYKNTHLKDFERIRVGSSHLDVIYRRSRRIIASGLDNESQKLAELHAGGKVVASSVERAAELGDALQALVERWLPRLGRAGHTATYWIAGHDWPGNRVGTVEFWEQIIDSGFPLQIRVNSDPLFELTPDFLRADLGVLVPEHWKHQESADLDAAIERVRSVQQWLRTADFAQLLDPRVPLRLDGGVAELLPDDLQLDPLFRDLLTHGLLDRNFALYASEFYGIIASADAMTYVIQHLQTDHPDHDFPLSEDKDVPAVLSLGGDRAFESAGLFNIAIYDSLLNAHDPRLNRNLELLAVADDEASGFVHSYLRRGKLPEELVKQLARHWSGVFDFIGSESADLALDQSALVVAAFGAVNLSREYTMPDAMKRIIADAPHNIEELTTAPSPDRAIAALKKLGIRLVSLAKVSPAARKGVIEARQYEVNRPNLQLAVGDSQPIALDVIMQLGDSTFDHVLGLFDYYLGTLDREELHSIADVSTAIEVMEAVELAEPGGAIEVARRMPPTMKIDDVQGVPTELLSVLAKTQRFPLTQSNVTRYIAARSLDDAIVNYLADSPRLELEDDVDAVARDALATKLVTEQNLGVSTRVQLVDQLVDVVRPSAGIGLEPELVTSLMKADLLEDSLNTFNTLASVDAQEAFVVASTTVGDWIAASGAPASLIVRVVRNPDVLSRVKSLIVEALPRTGLWASTEVMEALGAWAEVEVSPFTVDTLQMIQASAVSTRAKVAVLSASVEVAPSLVSQYVAQLDHPYRQILERAHTYVDLPLLPDPSPILQLLKDSDTAVSSFDQVNGMMRVYRRHPIE